MRCPRPQRKTLSKHLDDPDPDPDADADAECFWSSVADDVNAPRELQRRGLL